VVRKLKDDLARGEVDEKLLEELGWDRERMARFVEQMEQALRDSGNDQSPEAIRRRRQFETTLEALKLPQANEKRRGTSTRTTRANEIGGKHSAPPSEYRDRYEAYTKSLKSAPMEKKK
jgi:hypothetical protein